MENKILFAIIGGTLLFVIGISFFLGRPQPIKTIDTVILAGDSSHFLGNKEAKIIVVEFSDYQCPACKNAQPMVLEILKKYQNRIKFVYRHFPLPQHEFAAVSAYAAEAAGLQNKFWEYHDKLFEKSPELSRDQLIKYAQELDLNMDQFTKDLDADTVKQKVLADQADGTKAGIEFTPTFYINGTPLPSGATLTDMEKEIEARLK